MMAVVIAEVSEMPASEVLDPFKNPNCSGGM